MDKENRIPRPRFTIRSPRRHHRVIRHHNPGTRRQRERPRIRVLSSITVVPPKPTTVPYPIPRSTQQPTLRLSPAHRHHRREPSPQPSSSRVHLDELNNVEPEVPWRTPESIGVTPTHSPWREQRSLVPKPLVTYGEEFNIVPGEACQAVPIYIDRDIPWRLRPIDVPRRRQIRFYRSDVRDPRMHDMRVEVSPLRISPPREPSNPTADSVPLFTPPVQRAESEMPRPTTSAGESSRISDELAALLRLARMFQGPRSDTEPAYRAYKHSRRATRRRR